MIQAIFPNGINTITVQGLTQWDYGQTLSISGITLADGTQVHFGNKNRETAYVYAVANNTVDIPDTLLQESQTIYAWIYVASATEGETIKTIILPVIARKRPDDYYSYNSSHLVLPTLRKIKHIELGTGETADMLSITKDENGNAFELSEIFFTAHFVFDAVAGSNCSIRIRTDGGQRYMVIKSNISLSTGLITCSGAANAHNGILSTTAVYSTVDNPQGSDTMYGMNAKVASINYGLKNLDAFLIAGGTMKTLKEGSFVELWGL